MSALLGLAALAAYALGLAGFVLYRDKGLVERFDAIVVADGPQRRSALAKLLDAVGRRGAPLVERIWLAKPERRTKVRRRLDAAGRPHGLTVDGYVERKAAWGLLGTVAAVLLLANGQWYTALPIFALGWIFVDLDIDGRARRRQARIDLDLPDFLDVLAVCVNAGIAFRPAMARVADGLGGPVGEEVNTTLRQIALGAPRRSAFEAMRERNTSDAVGSFVTAFLQAEELGVPLADALNDLARDMRQDAFQQARRRAQRATPRVSLVVTVLIMPAAMLLIVASLLLGNDLSAAGLGGGP